MSHFLLHCLALTTVAAIATGASVVTTLNGTVQGGHCSTTDSTYFLSIPFADPPVGDLRLQPTQPFSGSYNGTLDATSLPPSCYQFSSDYTVPNQSEDCLYLNIWTPSNATSSSALPVRVWLYGGAFEIDDIADPTYNGCFTSADAIVVTINYRLGPLSYLALENTDITGNYGILDQIQGLQWVHDNIAAFGGNPEQILLFGQSAGAVATFSLATLPEVASLVNAIVTESGAGFNLPTLSSAQPYHANFAANLGCSAMDADCIRSKTPSQLNTTYNELLGKSNGLRFAFTARDWSGAMFPWGPTVGTAPFYSQPVDTGIQVPAILGSNGLKGSIFVLGKYGAAGVANLTNKDYEDFLRTNFGSLAQRISQQYPLSLFDNSAYEAMSIVARDYTFRCSTYRAANFAAADNIPIWTYSFNQTPSCPFDVGVPDIPEIINLIGPTHGSELPFVWGEVSNLPHPAGNCTLNAGEKTISAFMTSAWTSMARDRTPGHGWPAYSQNSTQGINFEDSRVLPGTVDYSMCTFWDQIHNALMKATSTDNSTAPANMTTMSTHLPSHATGGGSRNSAFMNYYFVPLGLALGTMYSL